MAPPVITVTRQQAPCSRVVDGESHSDQDGEGLVIKDTVLRVRLQERLP